MRPSAAESLVVGSNKNKNKNNSNGNISAMVVAVATLASAVGRAAAFSSTARSAMLRRPMLSSRRTIPTPTRGLGFDGSSCTRGSTAGGPSMLHSETGRGFCLWAAAVDDADADTSVDIDVDIDRTWNLGGLRKETARQTVRCFKKTGKANERLRKAQEEVERLTGCDDVTMEELEKCPNLDELEAQVEELKTRLTQLNELEALLADVKGKNIVLPEPIARLALSLEVNDEPPARPERGPKKKKGPRGTASRLPYRRFFTVNKTEIRVGKQAEDNDELSIKPEHRDGADWWMHASGCPGSHVVIRCHDQNLDQEVVMDAAALAARQSKCNGSVIKVSLTRARDVKKPPGAKAGLVMLTGSIRTVSVNMNDAKARLDRLDETVLVN